MCVPRCPLCYMICRFYYVSGSLRDIQEVLLLFLSSCWPRDGLVMMSTKDTRRQVQFFKGQMRDRWTYEAKT